MSKPKIEPPDLMPVHDAKALAAIITAEVRLTRRITASQIEARTGLPIAFVKNAIKRLINKGMIDVRPIARDGATWYTVTKRGYEHAGVQRPMWMEIA